MVIIFEAETMEKKTSLTTENSSTKRNSFGTAALLQLFKIHINHIFISSDNSNLLEWISGNLRYGSALI